MFVYGILINIFIFSNGFHFVIFMSDTNLYNKLQISITYILTTILVIIVTDVYYF